MIERMHLTIKNVVGLVFGLFPAIYQVIFCLNELAGYMALRVLLVETCQYISTAAE